MKAKNNIILCGGLALSLLLLSGCVSSLLHKIEPSIRAEGSFRNIPSLIVNENPRGGEVYVTPITQKWGPTIPGVIGLAYLDKDRHWVRNNPAEVAPSDRLYEVLIINEGILVTGSVDDKGANLKHLSECLILISNHNSEVYLSRVFSNRALAETASSVGSDALVGAGALVANTAPGVTQGLNAGSVFMGKNIATYSTNYFAGESFKVMEIAIRNARAEKIADIRKKVATAGTNKPLMPDNAAEVVSNGLKATMTQDATKEVPGASIALSKAPQSPEASGYDVEQLLTDIGTLDGYSSINRGLDLMQEAVNKAKSSSKN